MRGSTLQELTVMFRMECGLNASANVGASSEPNIQHLLRRTQRTLFEGYDWPVKEFSAEKTINAGQRYYDFPDGLDLESSHTLYHYNGGRWVEVDYGISISDYNIYNPDNNERCDPVQGWRAYDASQFEIWPLPATTGVVLIEGVKTLDPLDNPNDRAELDSDLIVLFAAAEWLNRDPKKGNEAKTKTALANARLEQLRARFNKKKYIPANGGSNRINRPIEEVRVAYTKA